MKYKIAMVYPTCNRTYNINEVLFRIGESAKNKNIAVYIFDISSNDGTKRIVSRYIGDYRNIYYYKYKPNESEKRERDIFTIPDAEYIWMIGDKISPSEDVLDKALTCVENDPTIICTYGDYLDISLPEYYITDSAVDFINITLSPFVHFCSTIIKKEVIKKTDYNNPGFGYQEIFIDSMVEEDNFKGIINSFESWSEFAYEKIFYKRGKQYKPVWNNWESNWYSFINDLPKEYEDLREHFYKRIALQTHMFSIGDLLCQRRHGEFDLKRCIKDRKKIKKVIDTSLKKILIISVTPRSIANIIYPLFPRSGWMKSDY